MASSPLTDAVWGIAAFPHALPPGQTILLGIVFAGSILVAGLVALFTLRKRYERRIAVQGAELAECLELQRHLLKRDAGLRAILDHTNTIFFTLEHDGTVLFSEGLGLNRVKRPPGGSVGKKFQEAHPDRTDLMEYFKRTLAGETIQAIVPFSGGTFQLLTSPLPGHDGAPAGVAGILLDVTELEKARARVVESETMLRSIFDNAPYSMVVQRISDGKCLEANRTYLNRMGITQDILPQFDATMLQGGCAPEDALALRLRIAEQGGLHGQETTARHPDGSMVDVLYSTVPITYGGTPSLLSITVDITAQKEALRAKVESEARLRGIFNNSPLGIFRSAFNGGTEEVNPELVRMLGYADREEMLAAGGRNHYADPDERDQIKQLLLDSPSGVRRELMLRRKDGGLVPVVISASLQFDADGRPAWIHGVLEDLSQRKEHERELQFWTQRFEIANAAAQHIFYDYNLLSGDMQWIGAVREVLGYERQELDGPIQIWEGLLHPDDTPEVLRRLAEVCESGEKFDMDYRLRHKDGHYVYIHDSGFFASGEDGRPTQMVGIIQDISARKQAELNLAASEEMYRTLFESAQDTILVMDGPTIVDCNPSATVLTGCPKQEIVGRTPADFSPAKQADGEDTTQTMLRMIERAEAGEAQCFEWLCRRRDGSIAQVETSLTSMRLATGPYLLALTRDMSARKRAEQLLKQSETKYSKLFTLAPYCISTTRLADDSVIEANEAFERLTGYTVSDLLQHGTMGLALWDTPAERQAYMERLVQDGAVFDYEFVLRRKDGSRRNILLSGQCLELSGESCAVHILRDVTEMQLVQKAMVQTEKMMSLGGLAAGMAHEINNPLGVISQSVQGVQRRFDPGLSANVVEANCLGLDLEAVHEYMHRRNILRYLEGIREASERATGIVRSMLNFSRKSDSGIVDRNVAALVRQAVSLAEKDYDLKKKYDFRQISLRLELSEALPSIPCIPSEIEQVLLNLLRNAAQAMTGAATPNPTITMRTARDGDEALIEVEDNGPGIPAEQLNRVFEPFYTTKKVGEGTGLGLSVSYFIITTTHRGKMSVDTRPGQGTRFSIRLPLARAASPALH